MSRPRGEALSLPAGVEDVLEVIEVGAFLHVAALHRNRLGANRAADPPTRSVHRNEIHLLSQRIGDLALEGQEAEEPRGLAKLDQEIDVAVRTLLTSHPGAEQLEPHDAVPLPEVGEERSERCQHLIAFLGEQRLISGRHG